MKRVGEFVRRQIQELRAGGIKTFWRKAGTLLEVVAAIPVVLVARLLAPLVLIRFGGLPSVGIGPFALATEIYLCERDAGIHGKQKTIDLLYYCAPACNRQLKAMWERVLTISRFARAAERVNRWLPGGQRHRMPWGKIASDIYGLLAQRPPHLSFTTEEERQGQAALRQLGIQEGTPLVCFHACETFYYATRRKRNPHDDRYRTSDIQTQLPAMDALTQRGYVALRMGAVVQASLPTTNPRVIDYATIARTDFLDIFLCWHCRFYLGGNDGLGCLPLAFRRPVVFVQYAPLEYVWRWTPHDLILPKKLWLRSEHRWLTFREIIDSGVGRLLQTELYEQRGIELVDNTPEEITAIALEMDERLNGTWQTTEEDEALQRRFWSLFAQTDGAARAHLADRWSKGLVRAPGQIRARIGAEFLRQHRALLEDQTASSPLVVTV